MAEYSRLASGTFTTAASPVAQVIYLPFKPQSVKLKNLTAYATPAQFALTSASYSSLPATPVTTMEYLSAASAPWLVAVDSTATTGISTFSAGLSFQFGPQMQVASTTKASSTITTASPHGLNVGDTVFLQGFYQSATTGWAQICGIPFVVVTVGSTTTFTINWNTNQSNFTDLSASPAGAYVVKVLYPFLYAPGQSWVSAITTGATTTVTTSCAHNFVAGQEIGFIIPNAYGTTQLNTLPNVIIPGNPIYYIVTSVTSATQFVCNAISTGYTAFNSNQTIASVPSAQAAQVFALGTYNTGSLQYSGGKLYPSPVVNGVSTINGPAIVGSFVANTRQGFVINTAVGAVQSSALLLTASSVYTWEAELFDLTV